MVAAYASSAPFVRVEYEIGVDESVSTAVVRAVSAVENRPPRTLRPVTDVLDPGALDALFEPRGDGTPRIGGRLSFVYSNCLITIDNGEYLTLQLLDDRHFETTDRYEGRSSIEGDNLE